MAVQNSVRSYLGIAKEATKGTAVAPTDFIPVMVDSLKPVDIIDPLYDTGLRGSMVTNYNYIPGRTRSTFDFGGHVFPDTIGYPIAGIMGSVATSGASAPYTHTVSLLNASATGADSQPISYTLTDFYAANVRSYAGIQFHDFSLKFNADGMLEYDAKGTGWASATVSTPTPSFSAVLPTPVWRGTLSIGGSAVSYTIEGNIDIKRNVTPIYGISSTQNPYQIFVGGLDVSGKLTFVMENDTELTRFLTNTQPALVLNWAYGAGASAVQLQATITKGAYVAAAIERGNDFVTVSVDINGQANTTDAGASLGFAPIKWVLQNAKASGTYA
jgi:Phage tail tube protein